MKQLTQHFCCFAVTYLHFSKKLYFYVVYSASSVDQTKPASTTESAGKSQDTEPVLTELPTVSEKVEVTQTTSDATENTDPDIKISDELVSLDIKSRDCYEHWAKKFEH